MAGKEKAGHERVAEKADKREAILDAALDLFAARGYHGATMPEVADLAGVGAGTIYRYFENKEALVNTLFRLWKGQLGVSLMDDFPFALPVRQQFHEIWRRLATFAKRHPKALEFLEMHHHGDYLDADSLAVEKAMMGPLRAYIEDAQNKQAIKLAPAEMLGSLVYGAFMGLISAQKKKLITLTNEVLGDAEQCMWEAVRR
jgi:AcrR family transcriptional regulator